MGTDTQIKNEFKNKKLIVITRNDLTPGQQSSQSVHSVTNFIFEHPTIASDWHKTSKYLVLLSVKDEAELLSLVNKLDQKGIVYSKFYEPDFNNELTSITIEPSEKSRKATSSLPLLLKGYRKDVELCTV